MQHEKIIKREDGTRIKIIVGIYFANNWTLYRQVIWIESIMICYSGKKTWIEASTHIVIPSEILSAKLELWQKLKPTL